MLARALTNQCNRYVVFQTKHLGDAVLALPVVYKLLRLDEHSLICVITNPSCKPIFTNLDARVIVIEKPRDLASWIRLVIDLYKANALFALHRSMTACWIAAVCNIKLLGHYEEKKKPWFIAESKFTAVPYLDQNHVVTNNLALLEAHGISVNQSDRSVDLSHLLKRSTGRFKLSSPYIIVHLGSRWLFKTPKDDFWIRLIGMLHKNGFKIVLTGSDSGNEGEKIKRISQVTGCESLSGLTAIGELIQIINEAVLFIGVDTFASHIASAVGTPGIVLFGPTDDRQWGPNGDNTRIELITSDKHPCRPCNQDGCSGTKRSECLDSLDPLIICDRVLNILRFGS